MIQEKGATSEVSDRPPAAPIFPLRPLSAFSPPLSSLTFPPMSLVPLMPVGFSCVVVVFDPIPIFSAAAAAVS